MLGALDMTRERDEVATLMKGFMSALKNAATGEHRIGLRYSKLLKGLCLPNVDRIGSQRQKARVNGNNFDDVLASDQIPELEVQTPLDLNIPETSNIGMETPSPSWAESSAFDPFWGSWSYFMSDNNSMLPDGDKAFGMSEEGQSWTTSFNGYG